MKKTEAVSSKAVSSKAELGIGSLRPGTVQFVVEEGIYAKSLHKIIDQVINLHGCTACGLSGIDLRFKVRDNILFEKFEKIDGIVDVTIQR